MTIQFARRAAIAAIALVAVAGAAEAKSKIATTAKGTTTQQAQPYYGYPHVQPSAAYIKDGNRRNFRSVDRDTTNEGFATVTAPKVGR